MWGKPAKGGIIGFRGIKFTAEFLLSSQHYVLATIMLYNPAEYSLYGPWTRPRTAQKSRAVRSLNSASRDSACTACCNSPLLTLLYNLKSACSSAAERPGVQPCLLPLSQLAWPSPSALQLALFLSQAPSFSFAKKWVCVSSPSASFLSFHFTLFPPLVNFLEESGKIHFKWTVKYYFLKSET